VSERVENRQTERKQRGRVQRVRRDGEQCVCVCVCTCDEGRERERKTEEAEKRVRDEEKVRYTLGE
jgi:hypothetical protein